MVLIVNVSQDLLDGLLISSTHHHETHTISSGLSNNGRVSISKEHLLELIINLRVIGGHGNKTKSKTNSMLDGGVLSAIFIAIQEVIDEVLRVLVLVDETIGKVGTSSGIW